MNTFDEVLSHTRNTEQYKAALNGTYANLGKLENIEAEIENAVATEIQRLKDMKLKGEHHLSAQERCEADEDAERLARLDDSEDEDSGDESLRKKERRASEALSDLEDVKLEAKKRLEKAKSAAKVERVRQQKGIRTYAHPASIAARSQSDQEDKCGVGHAAAKEALLRKEMKGFVLSSNR
mmetsp:Transcript_50050/g.95601  ORF Transcript_50050/g.95601 Transcript_50050/m.95601 type:complete len:181 (-) Transcript_50050:171-713(-)|eukprot:CAMPEP_0114237216 /NCGR_PEP_ID=MMETSP0058-20121206/7265_1 /TAXON_ID=36894 /ORGANISM="Pyramimonas parkeae, CCMP726" /LENGTH=180 /DNA_ID=CAMNT_0001349229 /DNA_START=94 /DNA_END=639 /DNA_ORIENTATION=-